ncbi:sugar ABC transporter permease [Humibacter sp. BT305]|uniref:Xylose transport system permease protein XylH n=1 Tax=Cnuibacter physcomitrellae TaxID=1619308 RepID=A0A1X9LQG4_9MICO|nr:multiple monosaccharide ABC transporter permease [Cnuibacter physcomitrellae]ARJ06181.1 sugar ABC transporter permease [Cnuibacter physcomitrellae]AXH35157.1 sugar ABC transporter permease [Humibacter sp. BT305]MCS5496035.1 sugar ABC transporter permease [Cnuibacter physcomitrellae]GGI37404.1 ABC transporter permease [Cnuibacter physcomitrellae]
MTTTTDTSAPKKSGGLADIKKVFGRSQSTARQFGILGSLIVIILLFEVLTGGLTLSSTNLINVVQQYSYILILAIGMVMVIIMGHIDLSVGSVAAFVGIVVAKSMADWNLPWPLAIVLGLVVGALIGAWQGFWVAYVGVPAFIVTLAGMLIFRGANQVVGQSTTTPVPQDFGKIGAGYLPELPIALPFNFLTMVLGLLGVVWVVFNEIRLRRRQHKTGSDSAPLWVSIVKVVIISAIILAAAYLFATGRVGTSFPISGIILVVLVIIYTFITNNTTFGRRIYAVGGNRLAATLSGVKDRRVDFFVMMNMSVLAALAGMIFIARSTASGPQDGNGWELDAIAAVFIGGAAVSGGIGTVIGSIIGGLVMAFLNNGLQLLGVGADYVSIIKGLVLLLAVGVDVLSKASGRPSILGIWSSRRRARAADGPTEPPTVLPTAGTNETSQPADVTRS